MFATPNWIFVWAWVCLSLEHLMWWWDSSLGSTFLCWLNLQKWWLCSGHTHPKLPFLTMQLIPQPFFPRLWSGKQSNFCTFLKPSLLVWWLNIKAICVNRAVLFFFLRWTKTALAFMFFYSWGGWSWTPVFQSFLSPAQSCSEQSPRPRSLLRTAYNRPSFSLSSFKHQ